MAAGVERRSPLRILCPEPESYSRAGLGEMARYGQIDARSLTQAELEREAGNHDVLMLRLKLHLTEGILRGKGRALVAVLSPTTGVNHLALPLAEELGVPIFHLRGERAFLDTIHSTAEHTFGLMLALGRRLVPAVSSVRAGEWTPQRFRGRELSGKRLGIVGFGRLGSIVARYAQAFDMSVATYDPFVAQLPSGVVRCETLLELCLQSDVLSVHAPWNESTQGLIGRTELAALPAGALVINTARGELLDEAALIDELRSGRLAGAAVDVLAEEHAAVSAGSPMLDYARQHENLIITPHIGGATEEAVEKTDRFVIDKFARWLAASGGD
jgi:D-3-phosphoglycerate dehydrogenase